MMPAILKQARLKIAGIIKIIIISVQKNKLE